MKPMKKHKDFRSALRDPFQSYFDMIIFLSLTNIVHKSFVINISNLFVERELFMANVSDTVMYRITFERVSQVPRKHIQL